jgi:hypothetical protein
VMDLAAGDGQLFWRMTVSNGDDRIGWFCGL